MNIDAKYNSQFIQIDFSLLDDPAFLKFVNRAEFGTYLILRRYIWRGGPHRLGLDKLYHEQGKLASAMSANRIATLLQIKDQTRVSKHLAYLVKLGVIQKTFTGRENIFVLGEWHTPKGFKSAKEFYYLDNQFGISKAALAQNAKAELQKSPGQPWLKTPRQSWPTSPEQPWLKTPNSNREENKEANTVRNGLQMLPDLPGLEAGEREYIVEQILEQLKDQHSRKFYELVAAKVPASDIRKALAEIKADGANEPAKVFTYRMNKYAIKKFQEAIGRMDRAA